MKHFYRWLFSWSFVYSTKIKKIKNITLCGRRLKYETVWDGRRLDFEFVRAGWYYDCDIKLPWQVVYAKQKKKVKQNTTHAIPVINSNVPKKLLTIKINDPTTSTTILVLLLLSRMWYNDAKMINFNGTTTCLETFLTSTF